MLSASQLPPTFPFPNLNYIYTHVYCYGFIHMGRKDIGSLLITGCTVAINNISSNLYWLNWCEVL